MKRLPIVIAAAATVVADPSAARTVSRGHRYLRLEEAPAGVQRLAREWRAAAESTGVLDFMADDPLLDDYDD